MKVGIGRTDITPVGSVYLCGHAIRVEKSVGILDNLFCTALVIEQNNTSICFLNYDLIMLDKQLSNKVREKIATIVKTSINNVFTIVTHTHSGPEVDEQSIFAIGENKVQPGYRELIIEKSIEATLIALKEQKNSRLEFAKAEIEGFYGNRNNITFPADKSFNILNFYDDQDNIIGGLVNLSCHPTVLGPQNLFLSADLFGAIRSKIEEKYKAPFLMTNGAQGDVSNRQYRLGNDSVELNRVSSGIFEQVNRINNFKKIEITNIEVFIHNFSFQTELDHSKYEKEIEETEHKLLDKNLDFDQRKVLSSGLAILREKLKITETKQIEFNTSFINLGDLLIITIPGELFSKFAIDLKSKINKEVLIIGLTNYSNGYLIEENEYGKNYESMTTLIPKGTIEVYIKQLIDFANNMKGIN